MLSLPKDIGTVCEEGVLSDKAVLAHERAKSLSVGDRFGKITLAKTIVW